MYLQKKSRNWRKRAMKKNLSRRRPSLKKFRAEESAPINQRNRLLVKNRPREIIFKVLILNLYSCMASQIIESARYPSKAFYISTTFGHRVASLRFMVITSFCTPKWGSNFKEQRTPIIFMVIVPAI